MFISTILTHAEVLAQNCEYDEGGFRTITCYKITNSYFFDTGLIVSKFHYRILKCVDCNMGSIPEYTFNIRDTAGMECTFVSIDLSDSNVTSLALHSFAGQANLRKLELRTNLIKKLLPGTFFELKELEHLDLSYNILSVVEARTFEGLVHLTSLNLEGNGITNVEKFAFQDLENLQVLNLNQNLLTSLDAEMFAGLVSLESFSIKANKITVINRYTFDNFTYLENLNLDENKIQKFPRDLLVLTNKIKILHLSFNPVGSLIFNNITSKSLEELYFEKCSIIDIKEQLFSNIPSLRILNLAGNKIKLFNVKDFSRGASLQMLNLSHNTINYVNLSLATSRSLQKLDLSFNHIVDFEYQDLYKTMPNVNYINLENNSVSCNFTVELEEYLKFEEIKVNFNRNVCKNNLYLLKTQTVKEEVTGLHESTSTSNTYHMWYLLFALLFVVILLLVATLFYLYRTNINIQNIGNIVNSSSVPLLPIE